MKRIELAEELEGLNTLIMVQRKLGVDRAKAIYLMHLLRKAGYVKTFREADRRRVYHISPTHALGGITYIDILNKYSPIKLVSEDVHKIYGDKSSLEETLVYAIKRRSVRYAIASLILFRKIKDWTRLYRLGKEEGIIREIGALYDVARLLIPKVRRMPKRFFNNAIPKKNDKFKYIIEGISSDDFKDIERKWKVYIPLNAGDLNEYRGIFSS